MDCIYKYMVGSPTAWIFIRVNIFSSFLDVFQADHVRVKLLIWELWYLHINKKIASKDQILTRQGCLGSSFKDNFKNNERELKMIYNIHHWHVQRQENIVSNEKAIAGH